MPQALAASAHLNSTPHTQPTPLTHTTCPTHPNTPPHPSVCSRGGSPAACTAWWRSWSARLKVRQFALASGEAPFGRHDSSGSWSGSPEEARTRLQGPGCPRHQHQGSDSCGAGLSHELQTLAPLPEHTCPCLGPAPVSGLPPHDSHTRLSTHLGPHASPGQERLVHGSCWIRRTQDPKPGAEDCHGSAPFLSHSSLHM